MCHASNFSVKNKNPPQIFSFSDTLLDSEANDLVLLPPNPTKTTHGQRRNSEIPEPRVSLRSAPTGPRFQSRPDGGDGNHPRSLRLWQFMIAGSVAGSVEHMAMFPVDTVKTHMQALGSSSFPIKPFTVRQAFQSLLKSNGPSALYRGIGAMGLGAGPAHAVYFSFYETCKKFLSRGNPNNNSPFAHAVSGVCATVASDAVFTPMDMVKQRLQLSYSGYSGVWDCVKTVLREEGLGAFYASYRTTVLMNAPFTAVHFVTYEAVKRGLMEVSPDSADDVRLVVHATAGAAAGALAAAVTTPLDVVKTQLQCQGVCGCDRFKSGSIGDVFKTIVKKDGCRGLMRGWIPRMLFHAPAAAICWSTYETGKALFHEFNESKDNGTII